MKLVGYGPGNAPIYLNVYNLTPMNGYVYWANLGIFHSSVEVHGVEYAFGAHDYLTSSVFEVEPSSAPPNNHISFFIFILILHLLKPKYNFPKFQF